MRGDRLQALPQYGVAFDLESHRIQPGLKAPPPVCGSVAQLVGGQIRGQLLDKEQALETLLKILQSEHLILVGQNICFDLLVMAVYAATSRRINILPAIFELYRADRVYDIGIAEQLHAVARGTMRIDPRTGGDLRDPLTKEVKVGYRLSVLVDLVLGRVDAKLNDKWRESYAQLEPFPISDWPIEARQYPVDDACNTLEVALAQVGARESVRVHEWTKDRCRRCGANYHELAASGSRLDVIACVRHAPNLNLHDLANQVYSDWALHLGAAWGFLVDPEAIARVEAATLLIDANGNLTDRGREQASFVKAGILRADGTEDQALLKRLTAVAYGCTGKHAACGGTGKIVTEWRKLNPACPHGAELKKQGKKTGECPTCGRVPLSSKNCVECSATGLDLASSVLVPLTEPSDTWPNGQVQTSRDALAESGDDLLMNYAHFTTTRKNGTVYLPWLKTGLDAAGNPIPLTLFPHVLLETGRVSYSKVVQLLPRKGAVREAIVARPRRVLSSTDYDSGELITHAQSCKWLVGYSDLMDALLKEVKPHNALASTILGWNYEEFNRRYKAKEQKAVDTRQACKPANFGFPGRMGAVKLVQQQRKQGPDTPHPSGPAEIELDDGTKVRGYKGLRFCLLMDPNAVACGETKVTEWHDRPIAPTCKACIIAATGLREGWLKQWSENAAYFKLIKQLDEAGGLIEQHVSKRLRTPSPKEGGIGNAIANGFFQGLLADAAKAAMREISYECYCPVVCGDGRFKGQVSPLYTSNTRMILFAHDEVICEHDEALAHEAATRVGEIMVRTLQQYCPDLAPAVRADPALMRKWFKSAVQVVHDDRLVPWEPSHKESKCAECKAQAVRDAARKKKAA